MAREQSVYVVEQPLKFRPRFAFHDFGEQRSRCDGDCTPIALELGLAYSIAVEIHVYRQAVAAQRVVTVRVRIGWLQLAEVSWIAIVIDDHVAIEVFEIHGSCVKSKACERDATP